MNIEIRTGTKKDAAVCGDICYRAFKSISDQHNFPPDFPDTDAATQVMSGMLSHPKFHTAIAEVDGRTAGFIGIDDRDAIRGLGPLAIDPEIQNKSIGGTLFAYAMNRSVKAGAPGTRFLQATWHNRTFALYTKRGCDIRELMTNLQGEPINEKYAGYDVRPAEAGDIEACDALSMHTHGHTRHNEFADAISSGSAMVVERDGRITGYTTAIAFFGHSVAETNDDLKALIAAAPEFGGPGFLLPARNSQLFRWCLSKNLRVVQQLTLMTQGLYNEPRSPYLVSIYY